MSGNGQDRIGWNGRKLIHVEQMDVTAVRRAAAEVTRYFATEVWPGPVAVTPRGDGERAFKASVDEFIRVLYSLDVSRFHEDTFDLVEKLLDIVIPTIEIHLLDTGRPLQATDPDFCEALEQLKTAREGIIRGYSADPARRPSRENVRDQAASRLQAMMRDGQLH
jgi:hypothetical protein